MVQEATPSVWRISDFAHKIGRHKNTVDGWFVALEQQGIHYVNRESNGERVYEQLDADIAMYIKQKRTEKLSLEQIFKELPNQFSCRMAPEQVEQVNHNRELFNPDDIISKVIQVVAEHTDERLEGFNDRIRSLEKELKDAIERKIQMTVQQQIEQLRGDIIRALPQPQKPTMEEQTPWMKLTAIEAQRVRNLLELEAEVKWESKPDEEKYQSVGLIFKQKVERASDKQKFIRDYIQEHFEKRLEEREREANLFQVRDMLQE